MSTPEELVEGCLTLVHHIARQYVTQNGSASLEDLVGEGYVGLVQAAQKYEPDRGVKFSTFATTRIRGAILDALRRERPLSRPMAEKIARVTSLTERLAASAGREPTQAEVQRNLKLSPGKAGEVMRMRSLRLVSLELQADTLHHEFADDGETPEEHALQSSLQAELRDYVGCLSARDREIIYRIYWRHQKHREIARDLGISESRISQLQTRALGQLRAMLVDGEHLKAA